MNKLLAVLTAICFISACSGPSEEDLLSEPLALQGFATEAKLKKVWQQNLGSGQYDSSSKIQPVIFGNTLFAADSSGRVVSLNKNDGKKNWQIKLKASITSGVAYSADSLYIGLEQGVVVALDSNTGAEKWRAETGAEVQAPAASARNIVIVQTLNGLVLGLSASDGSEIWRHQSSVPVLSVRGTSAPVIVENVAFIGLANGKLISLDLDTGGERWANRLANAVGDSDIERITDIDATPLVLGGHIAAGSYNGRVAFLDAASGQNLWTKDANVAGNISEGFGNIYFASVEGEVIAHDARGGQLKWVNENLLRRNLGDTVTWVNYVAVVDFAGYLHLISQVDGRIIGRSRIDKSLTQSPLLVNDNILYVLNNSGRLTAYSLKSTL